MASPTIYYARHGQTDWNLIKRYQGRRDIPLNDTGRIQADRNGRILANLIGDPLSLTYIASPLERTRETMERMRIVLSLPANDYTIDERLIEIDYGIFEGHTHDEFKSKYNAIHRQRKQDKWRFRPPGGESHADVVPRAREWLNSLTGDCVVAGHGAFGRVLRHIVLGIDGDEATMMAFPNDRVFVWSNGREEMV